MDQKLFSRSVAQLRSLPGRGEYSARVVLVGRRMVHNATHELCDQDLQRIGEHLKQYCILYFTADIAVVTISPCSHAEEETLPT